VNIDIRKLWMTAACMCAVVLMGAGTNTGSTASGAKSIQAFAAMVPVLHDPRCMNCHSKGDYPRQGDDRKKHSMSVKRGADGKGIAGAKCESCHQDHNLAVVRTPPGAPDWHLPPTNTPMIWEGLTDGQLCRLMKDPRQNGGKNLDQLVDHFQTPLVKWGWHPGEGRRPIAISYDDFMRDVRTWASQGAVCPD
jgi:hypothetical protein